MYRQRYRQSARVHVGAATHEKSATTMIMIASAWWCACVRNSIAVCAVLGTNRSKVLGLVLKGVSCLMYDQRRGQFVRVRYHTTSSTVVVTCTWYLYEYCSVLLFFGIPSVACAYCLRRYRCIQFFRFPWYTVGFIFPVTLLVRSHWSRWAVLAAAVYLVISR